MRRVLKLIPHQVPEFRSHFVRRSTKVALIVDTSRKTMNGSKRPVSRRSKLTWLMPTQLTVLVTALLNSVANARSEPGGQWWPHVQRPVASA